MENRSPPSAPPHRYIVIAVLTLLLHFQGFTVFGVAAVPSADIPTADSAGVDSGRVDRVRLGIVAGGTVAAFVVGHGMLNDLWWKGTAVPFHINMEQDWRYALGADKLGHLTFAALAATAYEGLFRWSGIDDDAAAWLGTGVALTYQMYIEVRDGFSRDYGFSPGDVAANVIGASLPVVRLYVPWVRTFTPQLSYWPSAAYRAGMYGSIIDDYTSTTHWLSCDVGAFLPESWQSWYPRWIGIAVGHSVEGLDGRGGGRHVLYVGLDWIPANVPGLPGWAREVLTVLHAYHLPAPAIRLTDGVVVLGLKF